MDRKIIVYPDGWWEVSRFDPERLHQRHILMEGWSRWQWLATIKAFWFAWLSRNYRFSGDS